MTNNPSSAVKNIIVAWTFDRPKNYVRREFVLYSVCINAAHIFSSSRIPHVLLIENGGHFKFVVYK